MNVLRGVAVLLVLLAAISTSPAQDTGSASYSRRSDWSVFTEYAGTSSHIELGVARNRKIGALRFQYQRRLLQTRTLALSYSAEIRPAIIEVDPTATLTSAYTSPDTYVTQAGPAAARVRRLAFGNPDDVKPVGEGISEMRVHHGAGCRVYFVQRGLLLIVVLCGGDKSTQEKDIQLAKLLAMETI